LSASVDTNEAGQRIQLCQSSFLSEPHLVFPIMARTKSTGSKDSTASNATTRRLAVMNLALRGIEADFGPEHADTFHRNLHPGLRADYVFSNK